jgi:hypothetical protein
VETERDKLYAEVDFSRYFADGKTHWYPTVGWRSLAEVQAAHPQETFRVVDPLLHLSQSLLDKMCAEGQKGGN